MTPHYTVPVSCRTSFRSANTQSSSLTYRPGYYTPNTLPVTTGTLLQPTHYHERTSIKRFCQVRLWHFRLIVRSKGRRVDNRGRLFLEAIHPLQTERQSSSLNLVVTLTTMQLFYHHPPNRVVADLTTRVLEPFLSYHLNLNNHHQ